MAEKGAQRETKRTTNAPQMLPGSCGACR